jgi:hypothetical protein
VALAARHAVPAIYDQPRRDVRSVAVDVVAIDNHVAEIDSDAKVIRSSSGISALRSTIAG